MNLLPFGQPVKIIFKPLEYEYGWVTYCQPSIFNGHNWQYLIRTNKRLRNSYFLNGGEWLDEMDIEVIEGDKMPDVYDKLQPANWPPKQMIGRRPGIWGINGSGFNQQQIDKMLSWNPGAITCFYDYIQANGLAQYRDKYSNVPIIIRFQHNKDWHKNPSKDAENKANELISKWPDIKQFGPNTYVYFCNEMNLHYENGDDNVGNQWRYQTAEFYHKYADWVYELADRIKQQIPEYPLVTPPFAYGHDEDGVPDKNGTPSIGWAGYEFLLDSISTYFDNIICGHYYWGHSGGSVKDWLYGDESQWHAFRWRKVLSLFENHFNQPVKMIIDECGNFATKDNDFTDQLIYYANETLKDNRIIAMTYFLFNDPTNSPGNELNDWQNVPNLAQHLERLKNMPDVYAEANDNNGDELPPDDNEEEPPDEIEQDITVNIEYANGMATIRGNWLEKDTLLVLQDPWGNTYSVISGHKAELGIGGFEFNTYGDGVYLLKTGDYKFEVEMFGKQANLTFTAGPIEIKVRLVSDWLDEEEAEEIYNKLDELYPGLFSVESK